MGRAKQVVRRTHTVESKGKALAECEAPGASVARVALEHGLNANLVHRWRRVAEGRERGTHAKPVAAQFVSLPIAAPIEPPRTDVRIELKRSTTSINVAWPTSAASECASWLGELLRGSASTRSGSRSSRSTCEPEPTPCSRGSSPSSGRPAHIMCTCLRIGAPTA